MRLLLIELLFRLTFSLVIGVSIFFYDLLLTLGDEVRLVWGTFLPWLRFEDLKKTYRAYKATKVVYILVRYSMFTIGSLFLLGMTHVFLALLNSHFQSVIDPGTTRSNGWVSSMSLFYLITSDRQSKFPAVRAKDTSRSEISYRCHRCQKTVASVLSIAVFVEIVGCGACLYVLPMKFLRSN